MRTDRITAIACPWVTRRLRGALGALAAGLALLSFASPAFGQVAAPPLTPFSYVTDNPAAMQWGKPSRVGAAYSKGELTTDPATTTDEWEGGSAGVRLVERPVSGAVDYSRIDSTSKPFGQSEYDERLRAALAIRLGNQISLGVGQTNEQTETGGFSGHVRDTLVTPLYGLTLRPVEWLYLGLAGGNESVKHEDLLFPAANYSTTRDVYAYGAGIRAAFGDSAETHLEYYQKERSSFANAAIPGGHETSSTAVAEVIVATFLAGARLTHTERDTGFPTSDQNRVELGMVPPRGYAVVLRRDETVDSFPPGAPVASRTMVLYSVAILYQFRGLGL